MGILKEADTTIGYFLPMSYGTGAYNRYFGRLNTGLVKIRGVMARKRDTLEYVDRMVFQVLVEARSLEELQRVEPRAREVRNRYMEGLVDATAGDLAIRRRVSRLNYSRRCAEASAVKAHMKDGLPLAPGMEIDYVVKDAKKWEVDPERIASEFDADYYRGLLKKAWEEVAFVFTRIRIE